jgi:hypothetical protein
MTGSQASGPAQGKEIIQWPKDQGEKPASGEALHETEEKALHVQQHKPWQEDCEHGVTDRQSRDQVGNDRLSAIPNAITGIKRTL